MMRHSGPWHSGRLQQQAVPSAERKSAAFQNCTAAACLLDGRRPTGGSELLSPREGKVAARAGSGGGEALRPEGPDPLRRRRREHSGGDSGGGGPGGDGQFIVFVGRPTGRKRHVV